jgi:hypothetical protein
MKGRRIEKKYIQEVIRTRATHEFEPSKIFRSKVKKVLYIGDVLWESESLIPELKRICDVSVIDLSTVVKRVSNDMPRDILEHLDSVFHGNMSYSPDVIVLYVRPGLLSEDLFALIRSVYNCPLVGMNLDDKIEYLDYSKIGASFKSNYKYWARLFDLNLCSNLGTLDLYKEDGLPSYYFPEGCVRNEIGPLVNINDFRCQISFAGAVKTERLEMVNYLQAMGLQVSVAGRGWPNSAWVEDLNDFFRTSQINLGIGSAAPAFNLSHLKGRDIECPAAGACYLTSFNWELANLFEINKEILCYRNLEELVEILAYYSKRPEECLKIAAAGYKRCMAEHTWEHRFNKLFEDTGVLK